MTILCPSEIDLNWLLEDYKYSPPAINLFPKEWTIFQIDDSDFFTAKVKMDSKSVKQKKADMKKQIKALKEINK